MKKITKFHIDNKYYVKVQPISSLIGCCVEFPTNLLTNQPGYIKTYIVNEDPSYIEVLCSLDKHKTRKINVSRIIVRLLITEDILLNTIKRGISRHLIIIDGERYSNIFHILKLNLSPEELEQEKDLCIKFRELLIGKESKETCVSGFEEVLKCFENGGL